jgi:alpha-1,3-rhamnosyl/mannosyltransferase
LRLALAGSKGQDDYPLEARISALRLEGRVAALGYVPGDLLEVLYRNALVFVYPSLYEGFGIPPLEAMARGVPTVASDAASLPEVVGEDGVLVNPRRPDLLAAAIGDLLRDPARREELSRRGRRRAAGFTWRRSAERHLEIYKAAASLRHESPASRV